MTLIQAIPVRSACAISLCVALCLTACRESKPNSSDPSSSAQSAAKPVRYVAVSEQPILERLDLGAKVQPDPTKVFRVFSPASGRILGIQVRPGDVVAKGQPLALLDSSDAATARSDFAKARIEAERAARAADRDKILFEHGAIAEKDYIDSRAQSDSAAAELARAKQRLEMLDIGASANADRVPLLSPGRGVVLAVNAAPGEFSRSLETADPLINIADLSTVWIVGDVYEKDIAKFKPGEQVIVTVDAYPGKQWTGRIQSLSGALDPATRTLKVRVSLLNPDQKLKPEMFAAIHVDVGTHKALVVPASAIIHEGQATTVFVESNGTAEQRKVTTGQAADGKIEITSGLEVGQKVAADGAELLTGGASQP
jgi:cobalt-zinc-cadmium efflux system membrane fusion protein